MGVKRSVINLLQVRVRARLFVRVCVSVRVRERQPEWASCSSHRECLSFQRNESRSMEDPRA